MANSPSLVTRTTSLADFLATTIGDATWASVINTAKVDAANKVVPASGISNANGQLLGNLVDDAVQVVLHDYYKGVKLWVADDATERDALGSDDGLEAGDLLFQRDTTGIHVCASVDGGAASTWSAISATGSMVGPGSSTDNAIARFDGAGGATVQNSLVTISDTGSISLPALQTVDGRDVSVDGAALDAHIADVTNPHDTVLGLVLVAGNATDGSDIWLTNGDSIVGEDGGAIGFEAVTGIIELSDVAVDGGHYLVERATSPAAIAGRQILWAKNTSPSTLWTTNDNGDEVQIATASTFSLETVLGYGNTTNGTDIEISDGDNIVGEAGGVSLYIVGGESSGASDGQIVAIIGGAAGGTGDGGDTIIIGGAGGVTSGAGGSSSVQGGSAVAGNSAGGQASCQGGNGLGSASGGKAVIRPGVAGATGNGADTEISSGQAGATSGNAGHIVLASGSAPGAGGKLGVVRITNTCLEIAESAGAPGISIGAGYGRYWVENSVPSKPGFTGDDGTDYRLAYFMAATTGVHSVRGCTARGSTNTQIYRWSSVVDNTGSPDITYSDSATLGGRWTIVNEGIYSISVSLDAGHAGYVAIKAAAAVSNTFDETSILVAVESAVGITCTLSWVGKLSASDIIWIATSSATNPTGTPVNNNRVTITRIR